MLISNLYIVAVGLSAYGIFLNLRYDKKRFNRRALIVLFCGLLHILMGYIILIRYPQFLYQSIFFPISALYGVSFLFVFNGSLGLRMTRKGLHILPFFMALAGYFIMMLYAPWRYHIYHEYYIGVHILSSILFITYALAVGLRFHSGPNYDLKGFIKAEKKGLIPLSFLVLVVGILVIIRTRSGDMETYLMFHLILYIVILLPIIKLSLLKIKSGIKGDTSAVIKIPVIIPKNIELSYKLEIEKFIASKAYLDIDLNKNGFYESVNIPKGHISPFLKQVYGKNFNSFINELRLIYAAKELRREELIYTIDDLSFICGFRSRASFYRNFIVVFGCSPHQYRANQLKITP